MAKTSSSLDQHSGYRGTNKLLIGIVLSVLTYWLFAQAILNTAPEIQSSLGLESGTLNIGISITSLFSGIFIVVAGGLADKLGRMKLTYLGLIFNIFGSLAIVVTANAMLFIFGRVLQGLSAACIMPATMALVKEYYQGKDRQRALSFWSIGSWGGSGLCSLFGGAVADSLGWRYIFIFSIVVSIVSLLLILGTPESKVAQDSASSKFDWGGLILFIIAMLAINIVVSEGSRIGWLSIDMLMLVVVVLVSLYFFLRVEASGKNPFIDFDLFKNKGYLGATVSNFLLNGVGGTLIVINSYVQQGRGLSSAQAGLLTIGYLVFVLLSIRVGEKLLQKIGARKPMVLGPTIAGIGVVLMLFTFVQGVTYLALVLIGYALFGIGLGIYATPSTDTAVSSVPNEKAGVASGIYKMASSLGAGFGIAISEALYTGFSGASHDFTAGANAGLLVNILFFVLSITAVLIIVPKTHEVKH